MVTVALSSHATTVVDLVERFLGPVFRRERLGPDRWRIAVGEGGGCPARVETPGAGPVAGRYSGVVDYALVKTLHVISATFLVGAGAGSAYYLWRAHRSGDPRLIAGVAPLVVQADWIFTVPPGVFQLLSGVYLVDAGGFGWGGWVALSLALFLLAGLCWLPAAWLQARMRDLAADSARAGTPLPARYRRYARAWLWLGVPAFAAMMGVYALMVIKPPL